MKIGVWNLFTANTTGQRKVCSFSRFFVIFRYFHEIFVLLSLAPVVAKVQFIWLALTQRKCISEKSIFQKELCLPHYKQPESTEPLNEFSSITSSTLRCKHIYPVLNTNSFVAFVGTKCNINLTRWKMLAEAISVFLPSSNPVLTSLLGRRCLGSRTPVGN